MEPSVHQQVIDRLNLLLSRGWTRSELAGVLSVKYKTVRRWCSGQPIRNPKVLLLALDHPVFRRPYADYTQRHHSQDVTPSDLLQELSVKGWSTKALADEMEISWATVRRLTQGKGVEGQQLFTLALQHHRFQERMPPRRRRYPKPDPRIPGWTAAALAARERDAATGGQDPSNAFHEPSAKP